jgi:hypothetical protein
MNYCIATIILALLAATAPSGVVVEAFVLVSSSAAPAAACGGARHISSSSSFALAATPKDIQAWAASAALMTVMSFSQMACAAVTPTGTININFRYHPFT